MSDVPRKSMPRRLCRSLAIGLLLALGVWLGRYVYLRLTVMPPVGPEELWASLPGAEPDATGREIEALLAELCGAAPFTPPEPPAGHEWVLYSSTLVFDDALRGSWEPENRPHLRAVIGYLQDPDTRAILDRLYALRGREWTYDEWGMIRRSNKDAPWVGNLLMLGAFDVLISDARLQIAERRAPDAAIESVSTALWLVDSFVRGSARTLLIGRVCNEKTFGEIARWAREHLLDGRRLAQLQRQVRELRPLPQFWDSRVENEGRFLQATIDALYTRRADGNGWYVPSRYAAVRPHFDWRRPDFAQRAALWNLLSVFYNDRATAEAKLRAYVTGWSALPELPYAEARAVADGLMHRAEMFNVLDGRPLSDSHGLWQSYRLVSLGESQRRGTLMVLALERYWLDHGVYPTALAALVPEYLESLPADPLADGPFSYRHDEAGGCVLWSYDLDGDDDGGSPSSVMTADGDLVFTLPRDNALYEPRLRPVEPADAAPNGAPPRER